MVLPLFLGVALSAHARIGETQPQLEKRYGKPEAPPPWGRDEGARRTLNFSWSGYKVAATLSSGICVREIVFAVRASVFSSPSDFTKADALEMAQKIAGTNLVVDADSPLKGRSVDEQRRSWKWSYWRTAAGGIRADYEEADYELKALGLGNILRVMTLPEAERFRETNSQSHSNRLDRF